MLIVKEIVESTEGKLLNGKENIEPKNYEFDSRLIVEGTFFIPIKGEKTDGHRYILECVEKGISGFLIQKDIDNKDETITKSIEINKNIVIIEVSDTEKAIFEMGKKNREKYIDIPIVAVTGSVGKTSTREIIANVLEEKYNVLKTEKNYNNHLGLPYTLLKIDKQDVCVIEIGIDKVGEMQELSGAVKPDVAVITNIGLSHIEAFGEIENTYKEKIKICENLKSDGICVVNGDDKLLSNIDQNYKIKILKYGIRNDDEYIVDNIVTMEDKTTFRVTNKNTIDIVTINDIGNHNILNAMSAIKVGQIFKMGIKQIIKGISKYKNFDKRMKKENLKNNCVVINDAYNASYDSVVSGLETIDKIKAKKKIIIIGDLLELGKYSKDIHTKIGKIINNQKPDVIITYGTQSDYVYEQIINSNVKKYKVEKREDIIDIIDKEIEEGTLIYIKSSNGMKLYETSDEIIKKYK